MSAFRDDLSSARSFELQEARIDLALIGEESKRNKTFHARRAEAVREATERFPRSELPLSTIAGLVDLSYEMVRQIVESSPRKDHEDSSKDA